MISIIIPTFNERDNIIALLQQLIMVLTQINMLFEIIIVDDNSPDGTAGLIRKQYPLKTVVVLSRYNERGLSTAILYGIRKAKGDIIIGMDADFNHPPEGILSLILHLKEKTLVVTSRFKKGGGMHGRLRYICTYIYNIFLKYILGFPTMDNMSGFYAIHKEDLFTLGIDRIYRGYGEYHLRLLWYAKKNSLQIKEIPMYFGKRKFGLSKSNLFGMLISYTACALQLRFQSR